VLLLNKCLLFLFCYQLSLETFGYTLIQLTHVPHRKKQVWTLQLGKLLSYYSCQVVTPNIQCIVSVTISDIRMGTAAVGSNRCTNHFRDIKNL